VEPRPVGGVDGAAGHRQKLVDKSPLEVALRVAEHARRRSVRQSDAARSLSDHDAVHRLLDQAAKALLAEAQALLCLPPFGHVTHDLGVAPQRPVFIPDRRDDDIGPEARAVLAQAPVLDLEAPGLESGVEGLPRQARFAVFWHVEHREVAADYLLRRVALYALRGGVPGGNVALAVEHVEGVVLDGVDEQAKRLLFVEEASPASSDGTFCGPLTG